MTVPSFAAVRNTNQDKGLVYVVLGDSVGAGFNGAMGEKERPDPNDNDNLGKDSKLKYYQIDTYGIGRLVKDNGRKECQPEYIDTRKIDFIEGSFPALFASKLAKSGKTIDANQSWNMSVPGIRAKDYCYYFGLMSSKEKAEWKNDTFVPRFMGGKKDELDQRTTGEKVAAVVCDVKKSLKKADIINVELGMNDLNAVLQGDTLELIEIIYRMIQKDFYGQLPNWEDIDWDNLENLGKEQGTEVNEEAAITENSEIAQTENAKGWTSEQQSRLEKIQKWLSELQDPEKSSLYKMNLLAKILCEAKKMGCDITTTIAKLDKVFKARSDESKKYMNRLLAYIRLINPKANVVIVNIYNPLLNMMGEEMNTIAKLISTPTMKRINSADVALATLYNATVADISNTVPGLPDEGWACHPNKQGHIDIAETVYNAYKCDIKRRTLNKAVATAVVKEIVSNYRNR